MNNQFIRTLFCVAVIWTLTFSYSTSILAVDGEITYTGTNTDLVGDDSFSGPFNIGFTFPFYGTNYTQVYTNINGTLNFGSGFNAFSNGPLNSTGQNNSIYAFWDDIVTDISPYDQKPIYYATIGESPNRMFVTQWTNMYFYNTTIQMGTFQAILYESDGSIQLQYRDLLGGDRALGNSATVGIKKDNSVYEQYSNNSASLVQEQAIRYTPNGSNDYTVNNDAEYELVYLAPEGAPTSPTLVNPTDGTTGVTTTPSFEWLPVESATSYTLLISTASNFSSTVVNQAGITGTSYTLGSALNLSTQYYWRVQAINSYGSSLSPTRTFTTAGTVNTAPNTPSSVSSASFLGGSTIYTTSGATLTANLTDDDTDEQVRYRIQIATDDSFNNLVVDYRSDFGAEGVATYTYGQSGGTYLIGSPSTSLSDGDHYLRIRTEDDSAASSSWYTESGVAFSKATAATEISDVSASVSDSNAIITWTTNNLSTSSMEYGFVGTYGFVTSETDITPRVTSHSMTISNLRACARYFYRVKSTDLNNNQVVSNQFTFKTQGCPASTVLTGSEAYVNTSSGGTVQFTNNTSTAKLTIPSSFSDANSSFQINKLDTVSLPTPPENRTIADDNFFKLVAVKYDNTVIESFDTPVTFTITYGADIESEYQESTLDVYKYTGSSWEAKSCSVDAVANTVTCSLPSFSVYALFGEAKTASSNSSESSSASGKAQGARTACSDLAPEYAPDLFQIDVTETTATVYFSPVLHISQYFISYATSDTAEEHGALVTLGSEGVQNFIIRELSPATTYFFKVRGQRGCMPGAWSGIRSTTTTSRYLSGPTVKPNTVSKARITPMNEKIVAKGSPLKSPSQIPTGKQDPDNVHSVTTKKEAPTPTPVQAKKEGYVLAINVLHDGKPLANAQVELHSTPRYATTDENGFVTFEGVEQGTHTLFIAHNDYHAQEKITVDGQDKHVDITVNVEMKNSLIPSWVWIAVISFLVAVIAFLTVNRRRRF